MIRDLFNQEEWDYLSYFDKELCKKVEFLPDEMPLNSFPTTTDSDIEDNNDDSI